MLNLSKIKTISMHCKQGICLTLFTTSFLSGCSSIMGNSEYGCSGLPEKATCMSATQVYKGTNNGKVLVTLEKDDEGNMQSKRENEPTSGGIAVMPSTDKVVKEFVSPNLPDKPVPVRTPATVMKIWVNTWEDKSGDLNTPGYLFTEIEPRRWVIGSRTKTGAPVLRPLNQQAKPKTVTTK